MRGWSSAPGAPSARRAGPATLAPAGGPGAQRLGHPTLRVRAAHRRPPLPVRSAIARPTASSARLAVDFTVPRLMPVDAAISDSDRPP